MTTPSDSPESKSEPKQCATCGLSLEPLWNFAVRRTCETCGKTTFSGPARDTDGQVGLEVKKGEAIRVNLSSLIPKSLSSDTSSITMSREGIVWFTEMLHSAHLPQSDEEVDSMLESLSQEVWTIIENSPLAKNLDLNDTSGFQKLVQLFADNKRNPEWWAFLSAKALRQVSTAIEENNVRGVIRGMSHLAMSRSMLIFVQHLQETLWKGYAVEMLRKAHKTWLSNKANKSESFWQKRLSENSFALSQVFSYPVFIILDQVYVGGKKMDNTGGKIADFLVGNMLTQNVALIEIKTPATRLLGSEYRAGFSIAPELSGAITQALSQRDTLMKEFYILQRKSEVPFEAFDPQCFVIAGSWEDELTTPEQRQSFQLFRSNLRNIEVITYDELFKKVDILVNLLGPE